MSQEKTVGRPKIKTERKVTRTVSILPSIEKKALKHFKQLGLAIVAAVELKETPKTN